MGVAGEPLDQGEEAVAEFTEVGDHDGEEAGSFGEETGGSHGLADGCEERVMFALFFFFFKVVLHGRPNRLLGVGRRSTPNRRGGGAAHRERRNTCSRTRREARRSKAKRRQTDQEARASKRGKERKRRNIKHKKGGWGKESNNQARLPGGMTSPCALAILQFRSPHRGWPT